MDGGYKVKRNIHVNKLKQIGIEITVYRHLHQHRYVSNRLIEMGETAMSPSISTDMTDVDMASIAEDELSEKFSVRGMVTGRNSGKTKIVSI